MPEGSDTAELPRQAGGEPGISGRKRRLPAVSGTVAAGLAVLAVLVLAAQVWGWVNGHPGPGLWMVAAHVLAAAGALAAQRVVDAERGARARLCAALVGALTLVVLVVFWWL